MAKKSELMLTVGQRLARTRDALRLSQTDAARMFGVKRAAWNNYEFGRRMLDIELASSICDRWGVSLDWLYRGDQSGLTMRMAARINDQVPAFATTEVDTEDKT